MDNLDNSSFIFQPPLIKVVGIGGGGSNVVNRMIAEGIDGVDYCVINTDMAVLRESNCPTKIPIGRQLTKGQGAGMKPEIGQKAALEDVKLIEEYLRNGNLVFLAVGMGGGTGTGAAPIVAEISKELGILTIGVVTTPFEFEGKKRMAIAKSGLEELRKHTDTLMTIPNERLLEIDKNENKNMTVTDAFALADDVLKQAISGLTMLINRNGVINLDFADVKTVMTNKGKAIIGIGHGIGEGRGLMAAKRAIQSPILNDVNIKGATGVIINIVADKQFTLNDARNAASYIENFSTEDADVMFGLVYDESKNNEVAVTVIATGFEDAIAPGLKENRISVLSTWEKNMEERGAKNNVIPLNTKVMNAEENLPYAQDLKLETTKDQEELVELELKKIHLTHIERDPFIPSTLRGQAVEDTEFPAFLRRHRLKKNSENPESK